MQELKCDSAKMVSNQKDEIISFKCELNENIQSAMNERKCG